MVCGIRAETEFDPIGFLHFQQYLFVFAAQALKGVRMAEYTQPVGLPVQGINARLEAADHAGEPPLNFHTHSAGAFYRTTPTAIRTGAVQPAGNRFLVALTGHLHDTEGRYLQ